MIKIGLTGNIASGKSEIEKIFKNFNIKTINADFIVHFLLNNDIFLKNKIIEKFKNYDILENNEIDRKKLGKIVFSDKKLKKELEKIIHPEVIKQIKKFFEENKKEKIIVVEIPLLFENNLEYLFDKIILIYAKDEIRKERIKKRNNFNEEYIEKIMKSQINQELKKEKSDFIIINENKTLYDLEKEIKDLIKKIK